VRAGAQPLLDQLAAQVLEPARVGGRDHLARGLACDPGSGLLLVMLAG
jgi:hypothetical protein